jgi:hemoglobin
MSSMFERYGGFSFLSKVVLDFYDRVLDSDILGGYFAGTNVRTLVDHQMKFMASLMGGPASFSDEALRNVHARLRIDNPSFDEMLGILRDVLDDHEMNETDASVVVGEFRRRRDAIVAPTPAI